MISEAVIESILRIEIERAERENDISLSTGLMGICTFLFWFSRTFNKKCYAKIAHEKLNLINSSISMQMPLDAENGLSGIGIGYAYLLKESFINDDPDVLLKALDNHIYKIVMQGLTKYPKDVFRFENTFLDVMIYLSWRLNNSLSNDKVERNIHTELLQLLLNTVYQNQTDLFYNEPLPFSLNFKLPKFLNVMACAHKVDICKMRIERILNECEIDLLTKFPYSHSNRLYLLQSMSEILKEVGLNERWIKYMNFLLNSVNVNELINEEIAKNNLFAMDGLLGVFLLSERCRANINGFVFSYDSFLLHIQKSDYSLAKYRIEDEGKYIGLNGILGLIMVEYLLEKKLKK